MPEQPATGRFLTARYAFTGAAEELARTLPLLPGETMVEHGAVRLHGTGRLPRPAVLRLSSIRLAVLAHYAFRPDRVWDLPAGSVTDVRLDWPRLVVGWQDSSGTEHDLRITAWNGRAALDRPIRDVDALADTLEAWLAGAS